MLTQDSTNIPPTIEEHVRFIANVIKRSDAGDDQKTTIEATAEAEKNWMDLCNHLMEGSLFHTSASWIFGANVPGKSYATRFYFGGLKAYRDFLANEVGDNLRGYRISH